MMAILSDVKLSLGIDDSYTEFDNTLLLYINTNIATLKHIGLEPVGGELIVVDASTNWDDLYPSGSILETVKMYVCARVRLMFDTATMSNTTKDALEKFIGEMEWRINVYCDST